jgi:DnaJ-class molecular chaperone
MLMCPWCGWQFEDRRGHLVPEHGCDGHAVQCPGVGQNPRNPLSDRRPLWKDQCPSCGGTGSVDSGGVTPWGASIDIACPDCEGKGK